MRIYSKIVPLFAAEGRNRLCDDPKDKELVVHLFDNYDQALAKGKELLHTSHSQVSVYRIS